MSCGSSDPPSYCSAASPELKLYQAFIFSVPVFFTLILLLLFYVFYLRRRRANWQSLRMRTAQLGRGDLQRNSEIGLKKEFREMLPVVVFKESFLIRETQCSVCLAEYQSDERLQRIPPCGHTFHVDCIDHWLATNTTCPLCRVSLLPATKAPTSQYESNVTEQERSEIPSSDSLHENNQDSIAIHYVTETTAVQRDFLRQGAAITRQIEQASQDEEGSTTTATVVVCEGQGNV